MIENNRLLSDEEMLQASLLSDKYSLKAMIMVIREACILQDAKSFEAGKASRKLPSVVDLMDCFFREELNNVYSIGKLNHLASAILALIEQVKK